jgi:hypothetical protein
MGSSTLRFVFVVAFVVACVAFWAGWRRVRRVPDARGLAGAFRLAFGLSLALLAGCSSGPRNAVAPAAGDAATGSATGLGPEADAVWADLAGAWDEAGRYRPGVATSAELDAARTRVDGLLARLGGLQRVSDDAPGLVALLRLEFFARLEMMPADVLCYEPAPSRSEGAEQYERLAGRVAALEELASKGYANDWLRENILARLREDIDAVRSQMAAGDAWRTEDWRLREIDPAEAAATVDRADAALRALERR